MGSINQTIKQATFSTEGSPLGVVLSRTDRLFTLAFVVLRQHFLGACLFCPPRQAQSNKQQLQPKVLIVGSEFSITFYFLAADRTVALGV